MPTRLSPSQLNLFNDCPRCFYRHHVLGHKRPRGIFPSLPGGMDRKIKDYYDKYRKKHKLPPEIAKHVEGELMPDLDLMNKWRNWRTGLVYEDAKLDATLIGALDECLLDGPEGGGFYIPLDYKTRGSAPTMESSKEYYGTQLSCYNLMLEANGYKVRDYAYLVYYYPKEVHKKGVVDFYTTVMKIDASADFGRDVFERALKVLKGKKEPESAEGCEYCGYLED